MGLRFYSEEEWKLSEVDMSEIDGLRQIGGLRKEISDAMGKAEDWEIQSIMKGNGKGRCDAVVSGLMKEIDGLKKVDDRWWERQRIGKSRAS